MFVEKYALSKKQPRISPIADELLFKLQFFPKVFACPLGDLNHKIQTQNMLSLLRMGPMVKKRQLYTLKKRCGYFKWPGRMPLVIPKARVDGGLKKLGCIAVIAMAVGSSQLLNFGYSAALSSADALANEMLTAHNAVRAKLKLPALQWSDELASLSQKWADSLLAQKRFAHNPDSPYGENLFMITGAAATPHMVVRQWASESHDYDYGSNSCSATCGHYTQIVWRHTQRVGCAAARGAGREIWVCSYDPPGNIVGERPY